MSLTYLLLGAFMVLQAADGVTTYKGLTGPYNAVSEANPVARWAFDRFGLMVSIVAFKCLMAALGVALTLSHRLVGTLGLAALTAVGAGVLVNNLRVLRQGADG